MDQPPEQSRLRWQCRRGMRELDVLLSGWLEDQYAGASQRDKAAFQALLTLPDPELAGYLLHGEQPPDEDTARVVRKIRGEDSA